MTFDLTALRDAVARHRRVARVVIADVRGSSPRDVGASMLVWDGGQSGTIGGGALEFQAAALAMQHTGLKTWPLGPELGQCCGGAVTLLTEVFDAQRLDQINGPVFARGPGDMPLAVHRLLDGARARGETPDAQLIQRWFVEAITPERAPLWVWGAGHVGREIVTLLAPLNTWDITWVDTTPERFPQQIPHGVTVLPAHRPERVMAHAPDYASHLILTYSHELDLALCHAALSHEFAFAGVIGSDTKWARFHKRLHALGHAHDEIARICCPIGQKSLGKHPRAIAIGVASQLLTLKTGEELSCPTRFSASAG